MLSGIEKGQPLKKFIQFGGHGSLGNDEVELIGVEFDNGFFDAVHSGLGTSGVSH